MRIVFLVLLSIFQSFAFELVLNTGRENGEIFAVLHAKNDQKFSCQRFNVQDKDYFECQILGTVDNPLKDQQFSYFDLKFIKEDQKIIMQIFPKIEVKMYDLSQNIYIDKELGGSNAYQSDNFTFIFSKDFSYLRDYDGLDFNINFPHESLPYVGALDLNSDPVVIPQSADINTYLRIKKEFDKKNYSQVVTDAQNAINRYKSSIFMNEFILYKLRAQNELYTQSPDTKDQQTIEKMIDEAKYWTRTFTSDKNFPEVLYIVLKSYIALSQKGDIDYIMSILEKEQMSSYFTELARLDYADYIYNFGDKEKAIFIYENTYLHTKNLDLASRAAISLAKDLFFNANLNKAIKYIETVLKVNPTYFEKDMLRTLELAKILYEKKKFDLSASLYERVFKTMSKIDPRYENTLKDLSLALAQTNRSVEAKKYIDIYLDDYLDGLYVDEIKKARDEVFFYLGDNNATFLHQRYEDLMKQYENKDEQLAQKALEENIKLYYKEGNFSAILSFKDKIEDSKLIQASQLLNLSAVAMLDQEIKNDNCILAKEIFEKYKAYEVGQKVNNKKAMLACLVRTSQITEALDYIERNYDEDRIYYGLQKAQILFDEKKYQQTIAIAKDIIQLRILKSDEELFKAYYLNFLSLLRLDRYNEAMKILQILEGFPMNFTMVEAYDALVSFAQDHDMKTTILTYAPKAIDYQNFKGINLFSPHLEFVYLQSLQEEGRNEEALEVLKDLLKLKLSLDNRARALYIQSNVYEKLGYTNEQKQSLKECLNLNITSNWKNLCQQKEDLLSSE